jgi:hypothetical protein
MAAFQLLDGPGCGRRPVPDALSFVQDDEVRLEFVQVLDILENQFVVGEIEKLRRSVPLLPLR